MAESHLEWQSNTLSQHILVGLKPAAVESLHAHYGSNLLPSKPLPSNLTFFLRQLASPLIIVLLAAAGLTALLRDWTDTGVILAAVLLNSLLGFYQEKKAFTSLQSLKSVLTPETWVIRNGKRQKISAKQLVPFDVVTLYEGDKVPADGVVVEAHDLFLNEAVLTGESISVEKQSVGQSLLESELSELERRAVHPEGKTDFSSSEQVYMGTTVAGGSGTFVVTKIGATTEMGSIAAAISEESDEQTPLERRLQFLARNLAVLVLIMTALIFVYGVVTMRDLLEMFKVSVALAVSAIPEGLVIALTSILAIGMHRILKRKALVRNLVAAETLGTVTVVCLDKTGTLTEGKLRVVATEFTNKHLGYRVSILANEQRDPLELARWRWAESYSTAHRDLEAPHILVKLQRDDLIPFSSERRFLATRHGREISMMGAPDTLVTYCAASISAAERKQATHLARDWAVSGKRVIAAVTWQAKTESEAKKTFAALKKNQVVTSGQWLGLMGFEDPVRPSVAKTLKAAERAGITVKVITGDYRETAQAVLESVGYSVSDSEVIEGYQLLDMTDQQLQAVVKKTVLFARTKPSQKLRIVKALKANGEIVAMMGDGVNDAPALSAADIGLVVGDATEVAQEVADIVLLDSNFETILAAVEEGRGIFANLRKVILYLLSDTFSEVILVLGSMLLGLPVAITATQVLWINIIKEAFPSLALVVDPKEKHLLKQPPIDPRESLLHPEMKVLIAAISMVTGFATLWVFAREYTASGSVQLAQTVAFAALSVSSLLYIFSCRSFTRPFWQVSLRKHRYLFASVAAALVLTVVPIYFAPLAGVLGLVPLNLQQWQVVGMMGLVVVATVEVIKWGWTRVQSE